MANRTVLSAKAKNYVRYRKQVVLYKNRKTEWFRGHSVCLLRENVRYLSRKRRVKRTCRRFWTMNDPLKNGYMKRYICCVNCNTFIRNVSNKHCLSCSETICYDKNCHPKKISKLNAVSDEPRSIVTALWRMLNVLHSFEFSKVLSVWVF